MTAPHHLLHPFNTNKTKTDSFKKQKINPHQDHGRLNPSHIQDCFLFGKALKALSQLSCSPCNIESPDANNQHKQMFGY